MVFIQVTAAAAEGNKLLCVSAGEMGENKEHEFQQVRFMRDMRCEFSNRIVKNELIASGGSGLVFTRGF